MQKTRVGWFFAGLVATALTGCSNGGSSATPAPTPTAEVVPTPSPTLEPYALIMAPDPAPSAAVELAIRAVEDFASKQDWEIRKVTPGEDVLGADRLGNPRLFAAIGSGFGQAVYAAAQAHPGIRFAAVEETGVQPLPNLLVVGGEYFRSDQAAFLAGLLAGIENRNDYIGWIGEAGTARGKIFQNGFRHGIRYICPRCRPFGFELAASADAAAGISAATELRTDFIDTASAIPSAAGDAALVELAKNGIRVAGAGPDLYRAVFGDGSVAGAKNVLGGIAFRPDIVLEDLLPRFLGGETFSEAAAYSLANGGLEYAPFPNDWISAARRTYLREILAELASGRLDIGIDPQTGDEL